MKALLAAWIILGASFASAKIEVMAIGDVAVMNQNEDGSYSVVCKNGNREKVTDLDIRLNNVCPNQKSSQPTNILSLQLREDGNFDVVCKDLKKLVATPAQVVSGEVCESAQTEPVIEDGLYEVTEGFEKYCPQFVNAKYVNNVLASIMLDYQGACGFSNLYTCSENVCKTTESKERFVKILSKTSYEFRDTYGTAVFTKKSDQR